MSGLYGGNLLIQNENYRYKILPKIDNQTDRGNDDEIEVVDNQPGNDDGIEVVDDNQ